MTDRNLSQAKKAWQDKLAHAGLYLPLLLLKTFFIRWEDKESFFLSRVSMMGRNDKGEPSQKKQGIILSSTTQQQHPNFFVSWLPEVTKWWYFEIFLQRICHSGFFYCNKYRTVHQHFFSNLETKYIKVKLITYSNSQKLLVGIQHWLFSPFVKS